MTRDEPGSNSAYQEEEARTTRCVKSGHVCLETTGFSDCVANCGPDSATVVQILHDPSPRRDAVACCLVQLVLSFISRIRGKIISPLAPLGSQTCPTQESTNHTVYTVTVIDGLTDSLTFGLHRRVAAEIFYCKYLSDCSA